MGSDTNSISDTNSTSGADSTSGANNMKKDTGSEVKEMNNSSKENLDKNTKPSFTFKKKYIVLSKQLMWGDKETGFRLSWLGSSSDESWWVKSSEVPVKSLELVVLGIKSGILELTNSHKKWLKTKEAENKKRGGIRPKSLVWTETSRPDVMDNKRVPHSPSIGRGTLAYSDPDSKAFKMLQKTTGEIVRDLPDMVAAMSKSNAEVFLREAMDIEKRGFNRVLQPRDSVIMTIKDALINIGINSGVTRVKEERDEPITTNVKPIRFAL